MLSNMCCGCSLCHSGIMLLKNPEYIRSIKEILTFLYKRAGNLAGTLKGPSSVSMCRTLTSVLAYRPGLSPALRVLHITATHTSECLHKGRQPALL